MMRARNLLHRWFIEYNPLYLLSAALVLGGCFIWSSALTRQDSLVESLGIAGVAELYALALAGGAALLARIGLRRPAVMLALLFVLFQWDLTLHTETCAYLGAAGAWASAAWVALFGAKLHLIARALRVRFARGAIAAALVAAIGLALGPRVLPSLGERGAGAIVALWAFALGALHRENAVTSVIDLSPWGHIVLRRATRAAWLLSGALVGVHVFFWWRDHAIAISSVLPVMPLLFVQRVRSEARTWALVVGTLVVTGAVLPGAFCVTALLSAGALCLRALSPTFASDAVDSPPQEALEQPYRAGFAPTCSPVPVVAYVGPKERARAFAGALFMVYLAAWTLRWAGGPWPAHVIVLDALLTAVVLLFAWKARARGALVPLGASYLHFVLQAHLVSAPRTSGEWGAAAVALGFALLGGSLGASYRFSRRASARDG
jgi:hypothetical protein